MLARFQLKRRGLGIERAELDRQRRAGTPCGNRLAVYLDVSYYSLNTVLNLR